MNKTHYNSPTSMILGTMPISLYILSSTVLSDDVSSLGSVQYQQVGYGNVNSTWGGWHS